MKLLIVTSIYPPDIGGPATYAPQIAAAFTEREIEVTVLTLGDPSSVESEASGFRIVKIGRRSFWAWRKIKTVWKVISLGRCADVLLVNGLALEAALANLVLRKPLVQKVVGDLAWERMTGAGWVRESFDDFQANRSHVAAEALKALRGWWTRQATWVVVPSRYLARWVARWGVRSERIRVIYNAVGVERCGPPSRRPLATPTIIVTLGRLVRWKGIDGLIRVLSRLDQVGLVVIGDGPERARLEGLVEELGVSERVYFAGQQDHEAALSLMASCDLFALNSTYEGLPHAVLEAMSLGMPVVATAVGGVPEVVIHGRTGCLVPPNDEEQLYYALGKLAHSPADRQRLGHGGRMAVQELSVRRMVDETEAMLRQALVTP